MSVYRVETHGTEYFVALLCFAFTHEPGGATLFMGAALGWMSWRQTAGLHMLTWKYRFTKRCVHPQRGSNFWTLWHQAKVSVGVTGSNNGFMLCLA